MYQVSKVLKLWFSISPSNEYSGLITFRIVYLVSLQSKTLRRLLQHHNSKASIIWLSAFFMVKRSYFYMTAGKSIALTIWTFVDNVASLLFNMMSWFVIALLPRIKCHLISWLQSLNDFVAQENKICSWFHFFPFYLP